MGRVVGLLGSRLARLSARAGVAVAPSFGFENSGRVTTASFEFHLRCASEGAVGEVMVHPGSGDAASHLKYAHWRYDWRRELDVVLAGRSTLQSLSIQPASYHSLSGAAS